MLCTAQCLHTSRCLMFRYRLFDVRWSRQVFNCGANLDYKFMGDFLTPLAITDKTQLLMAAGDQSPCPLAWRLRS
jgi:hypothetical protein